ncbi:pyridoxine/pyridoxamine 5'-phosphate oxidase [Apis cerana]|uniref:pyridoxine/pyridoxamine 5'-phosphate oxidase n=1 Tax=Apis cerana TaxID=7461 RepID=UPI002B231303|nr:pyridoxine/pyridoxamine 5'-phosphate oxidase [Apis cerana]
MSHSTSQNKNYNINIGDMRITYKDKNETFTENHLVSKEPIGQFKAWFDEACKIPQIFEANTMFLATASKNGIPSVRPVLLKDYGEDGFKFYTNYESRKAREIAENPNVEVNFYWQPLHRSVRIAGTIKKTSLEDSERYFQSRPYASQIGSMASKQSSVIANRNTLIIKERELLAQFQEGKVKKPDWWGGYIIIPHSIEFWQGQSDRLHDRIHFRRLKPNEKIDNILVHQGDNGWVYERLSP